MNNLDGFMIPEVKPINYKIWESIQGKFDNLIKPVGSLAKIEYITCLYGATQNKINLFYPNKGALAFTFDKDKIENDNIFFVLSKNMDIESFLCEIEENVVGAFLDGQKYARNIIEDNEIDVLSLGVMERHDIIKDSALAILLCQKDINKLQLDNDTKERIITYLDSINFDRLDMITFFKKNFSPKVFAIAGAILEAGKLGVPVFLDGITTLFGAYIARYFSENIDKYFVAVTTTNELCYGIMIEELNLSTLLDIEIPVNIGQGALLGFDFLDAGIKALNEMASFGKTTVDFPLGDIK